MEFETHIGGWVFWV